MVERASFENPFAGLDPAATYQLLSASSGANLPQWPGEEVQRLYTGSFGANIVRSGQAFIDILSKDGAFVPNWKGLDYGAGFGRIASLMLAKGAPGQLDLADAWDRSIEYLRAGKFRNTILPVSEMLKPGELPSASYDFIFSFSVFSHLAEAALWHNLSMLMQSLKATGRLYITVRHADYLLNNHADKADKLTEQLAETGIWFLPTKGNIGKEPIFGETVVTEDYLRNGAEARFGTVKGLGKVPGHLQYVYAIERRGQ